MLTLLCRLFGDRTVHLVLEAIEIYGVRKYLTLWETYRQDTVGAAVMKVLGEEKVRDVAEIVAESLSTH